jgi:hypothetical protein
VEPLDDHRLSNPARHEPLLAALAEHLRAHGGDLRQAVRWLVTSRLYQSSSELETPGELGPQGAANPRVLYFARRESRPLPPHLLQRAIVHALGVEVPAPPLPASPLPRQLALLNGRLLSQSLARDGHRIDALFDFGGNANEQLNELFLTLLSRPPSAAERDQFLPALERADDPKTFARNLAFALLCSREFGSIR